MSTRHTNQREGGRHLAGRGTVAAVQTNLMEGPFPLGSPRIYRFRELLARSPFHVGAGITRITIPRTGTGGMNNMACM